VPVQDLPVIGGDERRMEVQRNPEALQLGPYRPELRLVEVVPADMVVMQRPLEPEILHCPAQLGHRQIRILQGQGGEPGEPGGMSGHDLRQVVVGLPGGWRGLGGVGDDLHPGGKGEHLYVNAVRVHVRQAEFCCVCQAPGPLLEPVA